MQVKISAIHAFLIKYYQKNPLIAVLSLLMVAICIIIAVMITPQYIGSKSENEETKEEKTEKKDDENKDEDDEQNEEQEPTPTDVIAVPPTNIPVTATPVLISTPSPTKRPTNTPSPTNSPTPIDESEEISPTPEESPAPTDDPEND